MKSLTDSKTVPAAAAAGNLEVEPASVPLRPHVTRAYVRMISHAASNGGAAPGRTNIGESGVARSVLQLQQIIGNRAVSRLVQAKLRVSEPGDAYEREADSVAQHVMNMSSAAAPAAQHDSVALRQSGPEPDADVDPRIERAISQTAGGGSSLPEHVRRFMEPRFGADLSQVRVHTDDRAVQLNEALNAQAFTVGPDVYYGAGKSPSDFELTAHELTHVLQQGASRDPERHSK